MQVDKRVSLTVALVMTLIGIYMATNYFFISRTTSDASNTNQKVDRVRLATVASRYEYGKYGFSDIAVLDNGVVWAVGYDGQDPQRIRYSIDGGNTWEVKPVQTDGFDLKAISFPDAKNGWVVGDYGLVLKTSDGGRTWKQIKVPTQVNLKVANFVNPQVGYIGGQKGVYHNERKETADFDLVILRTSDGGQSWRTCYEFHKTGDASRIEKSIWHLATFSEMIAIAIIDGEYLLGTEDGGATWKIVSPTIKSGFHSVTFSPDGTGWTVGQKGCFYQSLDKGRTWQRFTNLTENISNEEWWSIDFSDSKRGMAVGSQGAIALTHDGGKTWSEVKSGTQEDLRKVKLHGQSGLILGSQKVYQVAGDF